MFIGAYWGNVASSGSSTVLVELGGLLDVSQALVLLDIEDGRTLLEMPDPEQIETDEAAFELTSTARETIEDRC